MESFKIEKLNYSNYQTWKYKLELLLLKEGLWEVVSEAKPVDPSAVWTKQDGKAKALIGLLIEDSQLIHVRKLDTSKNYWDALKSYHQKSTLTNKVFLLKRICRMQMGENGDMESHINTLLDIVDQLTALGETLAENLVVALLLCSLPDSYNTLVTALESRPDADLTLELVKCKFIQEHKRRNGSHGGSEESSMALKVSNGKSFKNVKKLKCFHCGKSGHLKKDCYSLKSIKSDGVQTVKKVCESECSTSNNTYACFKAGEASNVEEWYIDSAATCHMTNNDKFFTKMNKQFKNNVFLADGRCIDSIGIGSGILYCQRDGQLPMEINVTDVIYVPKLDGNLLSVKQLTSKGFCVKFVENSCEISRNGEIFATANIDGHLYKLNRSQKALAVRHNKEECIHVWHQRFGHRDPTAIKSMFKTGNFCDVELASCKHIDQVCEVCLRGKMARLPFPKKSLSESSGILDLVHTDLCGPMQTITPGGKRYILTFIDDFSRYTVVYFLKNKHEVVDHLRSYAELVKTQFGKSIKSIRSDRGGEYMGKESCAFLRNRGIIHQLTVPYTPQQNGVAERKNRSLTEMARCMLFGANLNNKFWAEAVHTACYLQNRLPTKGNTSSKTPFEIWYSKVPSLSNLKMFGCTAYAKVPDAVRRKLDEKAIQLVFVGYEDNTKGYRLLNPSTCKITVSRDVVFIEDRLPDNKMQCVSNGLTSNEVNIATIESTSHKEDENNNEEDNFIIAETVDEEDDVFSECEAEVEIPVRRSERIKDKVQPRYACVAQLNIADIQEPSTYDEAVKSSCKNEWMNAMESEINSLEENKTWELVKLPEGKKAIGSKWVYKLKRNFNGDISEYKARLVAQGFCQKYGEDYNAVFAPVVKQATLKLLLALAGESKMMVHHVDIKTAFLYGTLNEEVYMKQPKGFLDHDKQSLVCKLNKSIYGLKQSARIWNCKINEIVTGNGFRRGVADPCLYRKVVNGEWTYILVYVDDVIIASKSKNNIDKAKSIFSKEFKTKDLGELKCYLGINVEKDESGYFHMNQENYINNLLKTFGLEDAKSSSIPMDTSYMKIKDDTLMDNNSLYRQAIGALLYIGCNTRPDIAASISILSRKISNPSKYDWTQVKQVFRYLKGTKSLKLKLGDAKEADSNQLVGYADADWAGDVLDRKSTSGYVFKYRGGTISWCSRKQSSVALSSTEAEYVSVAEACQEALLLKQLLQDFGEDHENPAIIYEDNQSCLRILENDKTSQRTKHIDIKYHFAKDLCQRGDIQFIFCPTTDMTADLLTKPLSKQRMLKLVDYIGLCDIVVEKRC